MSKVKLYWWDGRKPLTIAYDDTTTVAVVLSKLKSLHKPSANTKLALIDLNVDHGMISPPLVAVSFHPTPNH